MIMEETIAELTTIDPSGERTTLRETFYFARCDGCGYIFGADIREREVLMQILLQIGWKTKGRKHFCPKCQKGEYKQEAPKKEPVLPRVSEKKPEERIVAAKRAKAKGDWGNFRSWRGWVTLFIILLWTLGPVILAFWLQKKLGW